MEEYRSCTICKVVKPLVDFYQVGRSSRSKDRRHPHCKACTLKRRQEAYAKNPGRKPHQKYSPETNRRSVLKVRFGLTPEDYDRMLDEQDGRCGICNKEPTSTLGVDHNHLTGKVRGLLCMPCNTAIGKLGDTSAGVLQAWLYLIRYETNETEEQDY